MEITETKIKLFTKPNNKLRAFASIVFDGCFIVRGLKIIETDKLFVVMPSKPGGKGDIAHPINNDTRLWIENAVLDAYEEKLNEQDNFE